MNIVINPGTGPVADATEIEAERNMAVFVKDLGLPNLTTSRQRKADYGRGRFAFMVRDEVSGRQVEVQMPGQPVEQVRWEKGLDPWQFPRLYVDGSSWLWGFALGNAIEALTGEFEEDED